MVSFSDLGVNARIVDALRKQGITEPFEVQTEAIPDGMLGKDICCRAPTGSGKTLAFGLPLIEKTPQADPGRPTSLILTPTRELAEQIYKVLEPLAWEMELYVHAVYGGVSYTKQFRALERGVDILVACPGRLIDLLDRGTLSLKEVGMVVIDEADRMADMGFMEPVCKILNACKEDRQTILFSATLDDEVADLVRDFQHNPVTIEVGPKEVTMESMTHFFWLMPNSKKSTISSEIIRKCGRSIIFCRTRAGVDRVGEDLEYDGMGIETLHGGLSQRQRDGAMKRFQHGECMALVATDVAARGIDVEGVNCVIHYDPPENGKAYKHRSGRTARGGASGIVISLVQKPQKKAFNRMQREVGIKAEFTPPEFSELPEFEVEYIPAKPRRSYGSRDRNDSRGGHYGDRNQRSSGGGGRGGGGRGGGGRGGGGRGSGGGRGGGGRGGDRGSGGGRGGDRGSGGGRGGDRGSGGGRGGPRSSEGSNSSNEGGSRGYRGEARGSSYKPSNKSSQGYQGGRPQSRGGDRGSGDRGSGGRGSGDRGSGGRGSGDRGSGGRGSGDRGSGGGRSRN